LADKVKEDKVGRACDMHGRVKKYVQGFGGKAQREETSQKTEVWMGGWDQNISWGDWLVECGVYLVGSGLGAGGRLL
jgi:hypothetical protein